MIRNHRLREPGNVAQPPARLFPSRGQCGELPSDGLAAGGKRGVLAAGVPDDPLNSGRGDIQQPDPREPWE